MRVPSKADSRTILDANGVESLLGDIQRRLRIGYNRAARMIERMEREGVVKKSLVKQEWEVSQ